MTTYVIRNGQFVDKNDAEPLEVASRLQIIKDIEPYKAMAADVATGKAPIIGSRTQHREFLKRNNYIEVGNEQPKPRTPVQMTRPHEFLRAQMEKYK